MQVLAAGETLVTSEAKQVSDHLAFLHAWRSIFEGAFENQPAPGVRPIFSRAFSVVLVASVHRAAVARNNFEPEPLTLVQDEASFFVRQAHIPLNKNRLPMLFTHNHVLVL
jgi:hypothetical protein